MSAARHSTCSPSLVFGDHWSRLLPESLLGESWPTAVDSQHCCQGERLALLPADSRAVKPPSQQQFTALRRRWANSGNSDFRLCYGQGEGLQTRGTSKHLG